MASENVYTDLRLTLRDPAVNFISTLTGAAPTGDSSKGFSTGRAHSPRHTRTPVHREGA